MAGRNPHITDVYSPLEHLILQVLRRHGEHHPSTLDADVAQLFLDMANEIIEDYNTHPYFAELGQEDIPSYIHLSDTRPIADDVMINGLLAHYTLQQGSQKVQLYAPRYQRLLNRRLWHLLSEGSGKIQLRVMDGGTNPRNAVRTNPHTGMPIEESG